MFFALGFLLLVYHFDSQLVVGCSGGSYIMSCNIFSYALFCFSQDYFLESCHNSTCSFCAFFGDNPLAAFGWLLLTSHLASLCGWLLQQTTGRSKTEWWLTEWLACCMQQKLLLLLLCCVKSSFEIWQCVEHEIGFVQNNCKNKKLF